MPPGKRRAAAAERDRALLEAVDAERLLDVRAIDGAAEEGAEAELRADEREGLAEVAHLHEQGQVGPVVAPVLPEAAREARGEKEDGGRVGDPALAGGEGRGERRRLGPRQPPQQLERVPADVVVVEARLVPLG